MTPTAPDHEVVRRLQGSSVLACNSSLHPQLQLSLASRGCLALGRAQLAPLLPSGPVRAGDSWSVKGDCLVELATALTDVAWKGSGDDDAKWVDWQGDLQGSRSLVAEGSLVVKLERDQQGSRLCVTGPLTVTDRAHMGSRFGPNDRLTVARHSITVRLSLDTDGAITGFLVRDEVQIDGSFHTGGSNAESFTQRMSFASVESAPLPAEIERQVGELVAKLGDPAAGVRDAAASGLIGLGERIAPLLMSIRARTDNATVKGRLGAILKEL